jgi:hypothetical protein
LNASTETPTSVGRIRLRRPPVYPPTNNPGTGRVTHAGRGKSADRPDEYSGCRSHSSRRTIPDTSYATAPRCVTSRARAVIARPPLLFTA